MTRTGIYHARSQGRCTLPGLLLLMVFLAGASAILPNASFGAERSRKPFNLPEDKVEQSLKRFSEQSGLEVLFPTDKVTGVRTRAVQGEMTPREALNAILTGTGLEVVQDNKSGAFTVRRETGDPNGQRAAQKTPSDRPGNQNHRIPPKNP